MKDVFGFQCDLALICGEALVPARPGVLSAPCLVSSLVSQMFGVTLILLNDHRVVCCVLVEITSYFFNV